MTDQVPEHGSSQPYEPRPFVSRADPYAWKTERSDSLGWFPRGRNDPPLKTFTPGLPAALVMLSVGALGLLFGDAILTKLGVPGAGAWALLGSTGLVVVGLWMLETAIKGIRRTRR